MGRHAHSSSQPASHPAAARPATFLTCATTTAVIPGIDKGVPFSLSYFTFQCGHYPFLFGGRAGLWVVGLASFTFVFSYVYVYVRCLHMFVLMFMFVFRYV